MFENAVQSNPPEAAGEKIIVLLLPQALGDQVDPGLLRKTLESSRDVRVLLCLTNSAGGALVHALADAIAELGKAGRDVKVQVLLGSAVTAPDIKAELILQTPPSPSTDEKTAVKDQTEFALALSDVVLLSATFVAPALAPTDELKQFLKTVEDLRKHKVRPGESLPALPALADVTNGLDPERPGWLGNPRSFFWVGRLEQLALESFAFNWLGRDKGGFAESRKRWKRCWNRQWRPGPYFAPKDWQQSAPDSEARESSGVIACFNRLDRSALYGSHKHRDFVWMEYLGAASAVLVAVAGHIYHGGIISGLVELFALLFVATLVLSSRFTQLQDRWTACRLGAEQLRVALMSLPLLVLPEALATADQQPVKEDDDEEMEGRVDFGFKALQQVKRAVRQHGLPRLGTAFSPEQAAAWLQLIIDDQIHYHGLNYRKLRHAEHRLQLIARLIFLAAIVAVVAHFCNHADWLLLVTAAAPAYAAALHETGTHLGIVHRTALSFDMKNELTRIRHELDDLNRADDRWKKVRQLAYEATKVMGGENKSWHGLVRRYRDDL